MKNQKKALYIYWLILLAGIIADQIAKHLAAGRLKWKSDIPLIRGVLSLTYVENTGAAFGLFRGGRFVFILFAVLVIAVSAVITRKIALEGEQSLFPVICLALICSGAAGNLIDRFFRGCVIDFIWFELIDFPVFNIADIFVVTGCGLMILYLLFDGGKAPEVRP